MATNRFPPADAAGVDSVAAAAALLTTGHEAALRWAAGLQDEIGPAVLPGQAGGVAQGHLIAEPEPPSPRGAVVRALPAKSTATEQHVHAVAGDGARHLERA